MMSPIADFLPVFTPGGRILAPAPVSYDIELDDIDIDAPVPAGIAPEEVEERIAEARTEVQAEAAAALESALAEQAAELEARHAADLAEARQRWADEQGGSMTEMLKAGFDHLEAVLAESLVHVLEPFFEAAMRVKAVEELRQAVVDLLAHGQGVTVKVRGPDDLLHTLREAFAHKAAIEFESADATEVTIECDDTTVRSQLQSWADTLHATLNEVR